MNRWSRHSVLTDLTQRFAIALVRGDLKGVRTWAIPRLRTRLEARAMTAVPVMNEKTWRFGVPAAAFNTLLRRLLGGRMRRHVHVENLSTGVMNHEEHVQRSKRDGYRQKKSHAQTLNASCLRYDPQPEDGPR
jgi:hypothetical protein